MTLLLPLLLLLTTTHCLYFTLQESQPKCFFEETNDNSLIISSYDFLDHIPQSEKVTITVHDQNNLLLIEHTVNQPTNSFKIHNEKSAYLKFCFAISSSNWIKESSTVRFRMRNVYQFKSTADSKKDTAVKTHDLDSLLTLNQEINSESTAFINKQHKEMNTHKQYFSYNEQVNKNIVFYTAIQMIVMLAAAAYQLTYLHGFMKQNRII